MALVWLWLHGLDQFKVADELASSSSSSFEGASSSLLMSESAFRLMAISIPTKKKCMAHAIKAHTHVTHLTLPYSTMYTTCLLTYPKPKVYPHRIIYVRSTWTLRPSWRGQRDVANTVTTWSRRARARRIACRMRFCYLLCSVTLFRSGELSLCLCFLCVCEVSIRVIHP